MNIFHRLFEEDTGEEMQYKWFYLKTSPRGNSKFGVADSPWQRLRMFQQGTDEELFLDHLWIISSKYKIFDEVENELIRHYQNNCLKKKTKRAGHTEWFTDVNVRSFNSNLTKLVTSAGGRIEKLKLKSPYAATRKTDCPLKFPTHYDQRQEWFKEFWSKIDQ